MKKIGLISDTHMPHRWRTLPPAVRERFADVDLILHAGDVGELWVLDRLAEIAPVIAVHGNDDSAESERELPYKQIIFIGGKRILLWHSHYQNRADEMHTRTVDGWEFKLDRLVRHARQASADIVVYGHLHVPAIAERDGITLINPGAIGTGNYVTRPLLQSIATMTLDEIVTVQHWNLSDGGKLFEPAVDWEAGFLAAAAPLHESILSAELQPLIKQFYATGITDINACSAFFEPLSFLVWDGKQSELDLLTFREAVANDRQLHPTDRANLLKIIYDVEDK